MTPTHADSMLFHAYRTYTDTLYAVTDELLTVLADRPELVTLLRGWARAHDLTDLVELLRQLDQAHDAVQTAVTTERVHAALG